MSNLTVTVTGTDALGQAVTGSATAGVLDDQPPRRSGITEVIDIEVNAARLLAFAGLAERHIAAFRRDLERFMAGQEPDGGFGWFRREDGCEGERM